MKLVSDDIEGNMYTGMSARNTILPSYAASVRWSLAWLADCLDAFTSAEGSIYDN